MNAPKSKAALLSLLVCSVGLAQKPVLTTDETLAIPKLSFDAKGQLKIVASATSSSSDFDFLVGKWRMHNRRLNKRLDGGHDWTEFESMDENWKILSGTADMDTYSTKEMPGQEGKLFEGVTLQPPANRTTIAVRLISVRSSGQSAVNSTPERFTVPNPSREKATSYTPGLSDKILYWPWPSVTAERVLSISTGLDTSTVTPGRTPPVLSFTTPAIVPRSP